MSRVAEVSVARTTCASHMVSLIHPTQHSSFVACALTLAIHSFSLSPETQCTQVCQVTHSFFHVLLSMHFSYILLPPSGGCREHVLPHPHTQPEPFVFRSLHVSQINDLKFFPLSHSLCPLPLPSGDCREHLLPHPQTQRHPLLRRTSCPQFHHKRTGGPSRLLPGRPPERTNPAVQDPCHDSRCRPSAVRPCWHGGHGVRGAAHVRADGDVRPVSALRMAACHVEWAERQQEGGGEGPAGTPGTPVTGWWQGGTSNRDSVLMLEMPSRHYSYYRYLYREECANEGSTCPRFQPAAWYVELGGMPSSVRRSRRRLRFCSILHRTCFTTHTLLSQ